MAALDWIFLAALLLSMLIGPRRGLVFELLSVLGWILSFFVAQWFAADMAAWLPMGDSAAALRYAAGFGGGVVGCGMGQALSWCSWCRYFCAGFWPGRARNWWMRSACALRIAPWARPLA